MKTSTLQTFKNILVYFLLDYSYDPEICSCKISWIQKLDWICDSIPTTTKKL